VIEKTLGVRDFPSNSSEWKFPVVTSRDIDRMQMYMEVIRKGLPTVAERKVVL